MKRLLPFLLVALVVSVIATVLANQRSALFGGDPGESIEGEEVPA